VSRTATYPAAHHLHAAAAALYAAAYSWDEDDQAAFDSSSSKIRDVFGMDLEEAALTIQNFATELDKRADRSAIVLVDRDGIGAL